MEPESSTVMAIRDSFASELVPRFRKELGRIAHWTCEASHNGVEKEEKEIFHYDDVMDFWIGEYDGMHDTRLQLICMALFQRDHKRMAEKIIEHRLKILSVMVYCGWEDWAKFKHMVQESSSSTNDLNLPLKRAEISTELGCDKNRARHFDHNQWAFIPITIGSDESSNYNSDRYRPPFLSSFSEEIGSGAFANVMKVEIPRKFLADGIVSSIQEVSKESSVLRSFSKIANSNLIHSPTSLPGKSSRVDSRWTS